MYEPNLGDAKPPVYTPMDMAAAESMLKEAREILEGLGIVFFLRQGTCLGAVRDHALIEWDDDLDTGSIIGLNDLSEDVIESAAEAFRAHGFDADVVEADTKISVELDKYGTHMDWTCYRVIGDHVLQTPGVKIPVSLLTNLKRIDFLGEQFGVPNPPEEYLRLKYGLEWMVPKHTGYERDILNLIPDVESPEGLGKVMQLMKRLLPQRNTGSLKVLDFDKRPVKGAEVVLASPVLSGLVRSITGKDGRMKLDLPNEGPYMVGVRYGDHDEVLYGERLEPGIDYVYMPDPDVSSGRYNVMDTYYQASKVHD